jgi:hypothetical protein
MSAMSDAQESLFALAIAALDNASHDQGEKQLASIVTSFEERFGDNQKEVASSLQSIAKQIETAGRVEQAMEFKQRTTAIMLIHSMERRRGKGSTLTGLPALAPVKPSLYDGIVYVIYFSTAFDTDLAFYRDRLEAKITWEKEETHGRIVAMRVGRDPQIILVEDKRHSSLPSPLPVIGVSDTFAAGTQLLGLGLERLGEVATPQGLAQLFAGPQCLAIVKRS